MRIAYIASRYPYVSHVFILREVMALRRAGASVDTFTVRRPDVEDLRTDEDREAYASTQALLPVSPVELIVAHLIALATRPRRYFLTLAQAIALRGPGARAALWQTFYFGEAVLLWRQCRRRGIHHIHAHHANVASDVALLAAHLGGRSWSWSFTMHGSTEFFDVREHRLAQKTQLARFVICVSAHGRSQLMTHVDPVHWQKLHVVHCGVDPGRFDLVDRRHRLEETEILTVGRVVPVKGQQLLIEALAELRAGGHPLRMTIVGDGPSLSGLRTLAGRLGVTEWVRFAGAVGQHEIGAYYRRADVFALPSFAEGLPVVLIEAMATGLPVVASRITGIPELVDEGVSGLLVTPGRGDELTRSLGAIISAGPARRAEMGRAARQKVLREFVLEDSAQQLLAIFASIAGGSE